MHPGALRALEFDRIVEAVGRLALTPPGRTRLADLRPLTSPRQVEAALAATSEGVRLLQEQRDLPLQAPDDLEAILVALALEGRPLDPLQLLGLAAFLASVDRAREAIRRADSELPILRGLANAACSFEQEIASVRAKIDPAGELADEASPELKAIRDRLRRQRTRLRGTLESYLRGRDTARYLQEQVVTDRSGRYVLVVKAEHRSAIPGIVHGSSTSGASLYLEPLSTVEINNDIVALEEQERQEIHRILLALTDRFRRRAAELQRTLDAAADLDVVQARARFAAIVDGTAPAVEAEGHLELRRARHPLLIPGVVRLLAPAEEQAAGAPAGGPVPGDILLVRPANVLVITGPNTGGKTVALKCAGLLALMAQAGLHVPAAEGSRLPVFRTVFADIGDEQSIAASLSTFSWHVTNIAAMDRALALPALVLLDEVGAGTDPDEGGALGTAVIDHFRQRGALVIATTHYDALKTYASTTEGVVGAAFGFDPESFAPTYELVYGAPGRSLALEMAERLGLAPSVIEAARRRRGEKETQLADHLARVDREVRALEHERRLAARERQALADSASRLASREEALRAREEALKRRVDERLDERLREARREIEAVMADLKRRAAAMADQPGAPALSTGDTGSLRTQARAAVESVVEQVRAAAGAGARRDDAAGPAPGVGDRVALGGLSVEGIVLAVHDGQAEVDVRGKRLRAPLDELRVLQAGGAPAAPRVSVHVELQPRDGSAQDLNVIGCSADEAVARAEKFLDEALLTEQRTVRLIHGHGTGQLRRALAGFLEEHPLVARFAAAPPEQGGGGVTVVELKE